jgi:hypothetical protein
LEPAKRNAFLAEWAARDRDHAVLPADREIIEGTASVRTLIVELACSGQHEELYDASAVLGRLIAQRGGSPTLASLTLDHASQALGARDVTWVVPARAALAEGFASSVAEHARLEAIASWEFPGCAVRLGEGAIAISAGYPADDDERLASWAARVANAAARGGVRRAVVSGGELALAALVEALEIVGVEVRIA